MKEDESSDAEPQEDEIQELRDENDMFRVALGLTGFAAVPALKEMLGYEDWKMRAGATWFRNVS